MLKTYIVYAKRTPIGKIGGKLAPVRPDDLMARLIADYAKESGHELELIDDVIIGCANQAGEDNRNVGRMSALLGGLPVDVPATTINRLCASSLDAVVGAVGRIQWGVADCVLVGGVESMTRGPWVIGKSGRPFGRDSKMYDTTFGWRFPNSKMEKMFPLYGMGETAEEIAREYPISREKQDAFALNSHKKALAAWEANKFASEVVPVEVTLPKQSYTVERDEGPRADSSEEKLARLKPVFRTGGVVSAGNSSQMSDGAALAVVVSEKFLKRHKLTPLVEITGAGIRGVHPNTMGLGPVEATKILCKKFDKKIQDFDVVELNEAFAVQALACISDLGIDPERVNLHGGAIALGHPLGCSGVRILTTLAHIMAQNANYRQGLASLCVGVGQGVSLSVKNCL